MFPVTKRPLLEKHCLSRGPLSENFPMLCNMHALTVIQGKDLSYYCIGPLLYLGLTGLGNRLMSSFSPLILGLI